MQQLFMFIREPQPERWFCTTSRKRTLNWLLFQGQVNKNAWWANPIMKEELTLKQTLQSLFLPNAETNLLRRNKSFWNSAYSNSNKFSLNESFDWKFDFMQKCFLSKKYVFSRHLHFKYPRLQKKNNWRFNTSPFFSNANKIFLR